MDDKKLVGRRGKRRDQDSAPPVTNWKTDVIDNEQPGWKYQFFRNEEVRDKLRSTRVRLTDFSTGETNVYDIPPWTIVERDNGPEVAAGYRPDEGKPLDQVLRHGPHTCMKIPEEAWDILQAAQEQRSDAYESKLQIRRHYREAWGSDGSATNPTNDEKVAPGEIRRFEQFARS